MIELWFLNFNGWKIFSCTIWFTGCRLYPQRFWVNKSGMGIFHWSHTLDDSEAGAPWTLFLKFLAIVFLCYKYLDSGYEFGSVMWALAGEWWYRWEGFPDSSVGKESTGNVGDPCSIPGSGRFPGEGIGYPLQYSWASPVAQLVKNLPAIQETWVQSLGWEDPLEKAKATHSSILAWRIPWAV